MHCYVFRNRVESTCCVIVDADKNRSENIITITVIENSEIIMYNDVENKETKH